MKWVKRAVYVLVALGVAAAVVRAYLPKPVAAELAPARVGPMRVTIDAEGRARVIDRYVVGAPLGGELARVAVRAGDPVAAGAVVARVLPAAPPLLDVRARAEVAARVGQAADALAQARANEQRARVALAQAERELTRQAGLVAHDAAPRTALEVAETEARARRADAASADFAARVAGHALETARAALTRLESPAAAARGAGPLEVRTPVAGQVLRVLRESAGVVAAGAPLLEVGDPGALEVVVDVLTADAVRVRPGAPVTLTDWGGAAPLEGRVRRVEPSAFTRVSALGVEEQRVNVLVELTSPPEAWRGLGDGYRLEARIEVWRDPSALVIPASALFRHGGGWAVYVAEGGRARRRAVQIGERSATDAQVLGGLRAGAQVVAWPADNLADGVALAPSRGPGG